LSFRNEEDSLKSWHFNDRNKSLRQRRSLLSVRSGEDEQSSESDSRDSSAIPASGAFNDVSDDGSEVLNIGDTDDDEVIKLVRNKRNNNKISLDVETDLESLETKPNINDPLRSRRDATINCGSNVNTKTRQLNVGCSDENKIDVSPQCNDDGEEGEY
jgi:hypothetical protein